MGNMENMENQELNNEAAETAAVVNAEPKTEVVVGSDGQLSLFGAEFAPVTKKEEAEESCGTSSAASKSAKSGAKGKGGAPKKPVTPPAPPKPKFESVKLGEGWTVHYAGQTYQVDTMFEDELTAGTKETVSLEEIREKLATDEDCVELTEARTKWSDYDEDLKQLYPVAFGTSKGVL